MADVILNLTALNKGNASDKLGVYPWSSLATEEVFSGNKYVGKFGSLPSQYNTKKITGFIAYFYAYPDQIGNYGLTSRIGIKTSYGFNPSTCDYYDISITSDRYERESEGFNGLYYQSIPISIGASLQVLNNGLEFCAVRTSGGYGMKFVTRGNNAPYLKVSISDDDSTLSINSCSPSGGYQAKNKSCTFNWSVKQNGISIVTPTVVSSKFRWRVNASATATEIDCGTNLTYTLPANSITTDSFQWQCEIVDSVGTTSTSSWYTLTTLEVLSTAVCVAPINSVLDGSIPNEFSWQHIISTGTAQTKADLQYSDDNGSTWESLATVIGSLNTTTVNASFFDTGNYIWRVRTYNTDVSAGEWSTPCAFTVISAPPKPTVTSEQNPRPKISWQSSDQQGYRVIIDDVYDSGIIYGAEKNHRIGKYLDDGTYTVKVKIQNSYGIWSDEGSAPINVSNVAGASMVLSYSADKNIVLQWTQQLSYAYYLLYRDGVLIAKLRENTYTDKTVIGTHTYYVRGIYASSQNYGLSNELTATISVEYPTLCDLTSNTILELTTTESTYSEISIEENMTYAEVQITASEYPFIELSKHKSKSISFNVAYTVDNADRYTFDSLLGKEVSLKTPRGSIAVGILLGISKKETTFFVAYECTLSQSAYIEEICL